jgi:3-oxosteroid 1-dehydrogenase
MTTRLLTVEPASWDETVDALVAGSGGAGLTAALFAADHGARTVVVEKSPLVGGTTGVSGGTVWIANNRHVSEVDVVDSAADAEAYMRAVSADTIDEEVLSTLVGDGPRLIDRLAGLGIGFEPFPSVGPTLDYRFRLPGAKHGGRSLTPLPFDLGRLGPWADRVRQGTTAGWVTDKKSYYRNRAYLVRPQDRPPVADLPTGLVGAGSALIGHLLAACLGRNVDVRVDTAVDALVMVEGRVLGVRLTDGRLVRVRAGTVLATGGYEWNEELKRRLLGRPLTHPVSAPVADGDGLLLGLAAGADVRGLGDAWWTPAIDLGGAESPRGGGTRNMMCRVERGLPHAIIVNRAGRRFVNEATNYYDLPEAFGSFAAGVPNLPAWLVLDQQFRDRYPLVGTASDGVAEPDPAWLTQAGSLEELAAACGIDVDGLTGTVKAFNGYAAAGEDPEFGRGASAWDREWGDPTHGPNPSLGPIERGPFYAVRLHAGALGTKGGLRVDGRGAVVSAATGRAVPGLYAVGNVAAGSVPWGYVGPGATLGPGMTFGMVAADDLTAALR